MLYNIRQYKNYFGRLYAWLKLMDIEATKQSAETVCMKTKPIQ